MTGGTVRVVYGSEPDFTVWVLPRMTIVDCREARAPLRTSGRRRTAGLRRGDGARALARKLRLTFWREHLGPEVAEAELLDPRGASRCGAVWPGRSTSGTPKANKGHIPADAVVATTRRRPRPGPRGGPVRCTRSRWIQTGDPATSSDPGGSDKPKAYSTWLLASV
jgi:hypothetical protein